MSRLPLQHYIKKCAEAYETSFTEDWIENLFWDDVDKAYQSYRAGIDTINQFQERCFVYLGKSILSGEYIQSDSDFEQAKELFEKYWAKEHLFAELSKNTKIAECQKELYKFYEQLDINLRALFSAYTALVVSVEEKMEYIKHNYLFKIDTLSPKDIRIFLRLSVLRDIIIPLCELEHRLERNTRTVIKVTEYREQLVRLREADNSEDCKEIFNYAVIKANFILKKLLEATEDFDILIDCEQTHINRSAIPELPAGVERMFYDFMCIHEEQECGEQQISEILIKVADRKSSFRDTALLIHHYCSKGMTLMQINNLVRQFDKGFKKLYHQSGRSNFDNHALATLKNFVYNCRLSYFLKSKDYSVAKLQADMELLESIQIETMIKNFYPYHKACDYIITNLQKKIEERDYKYDYTSDLDLLKRYLQRGEECLDWCETHQFYPVQLPLQICMVDCSGFRLFLPSSISRPINYPKQREAIAKQYSEFETLKTSLIYLKDREEMDRLRQTLNDTEKRYLQIGSILIGVVTFLFGTINIFTQSNSSGHGMFVSVMGLGAMLVIFAVLMLIIIDRGLSTKNKKRTWLCGLILLAYTGLSVWYAFHPNLFDSNGSTNQEPEQTSLVETPAEHQELKEH
ncbi:hypothetical protein [Bacteroides caecimuris]|uniref:hypothetical protein n=1 Tax=Bacteroides caecimuris TaxID=1796613 RepID=UPI0026E5061D|nr:hypothetical protein [Bacteroides caecimuris]